MILFLHSSLLSLTLYRLRPLDPAFFFYPFFDRMLFIFLPLFFFFILFLPSLLLPIPFLLSDLLFIPTYLPLSRPLHFFLVLLSTSSFLGSSYCSHLFAYCRLPSSLLLSLPSSFHFYLSHSYRPLSSLLPPLSTYTLTRSSFYS